MILIADSGSTKTEWILLNNGEELVHTETIGLNPFFVNFQDIQQAISDSPLAPYAAQVSAIHFYGAGCSNAEKVKELESAFKQIFSQAEINVNTDIEGAVLAASKGEACIVCILGTGSTFRVFDGEKTKRLYSSLAYIIGDEGSGTYIAKELLRGVFYQSLPQDLRDDFFKDYPITSEHLMQKVYKEPLANRYMASFVPFCKKHIDRPEIEQIVLGALTAFYKAHLSRLEETKSYPVHFIGSIAHYFEDQLQQVAKKNNFTVGRIIQKPLIEIKQLFI